ncbi:antitoxin Xre/MbcA/ParS toxin-binding domain-containing protein [Phycisphaerales bacterium AB-hyl4]|uniref:Antitoxin Xre/MbcA/ParS toxin-binding domain-containing protein n=1 Tax=Natronomicrosphaera hydrolytica TaxID=3242702 RepID=A0ABV4U8B7_9BACT
MRVPVPTNQAASAHVLTKAFMRAIRALRLSNAMAARIIGVSPSKISRLGSTAEIRPDTKEGELALLFLRMFRSLETLFGGNREQAQSWFRAQNGHVGGVPAELVRTPEGLVNVIRYLDAMRGQA